ncbi:MAG TPA: NucA/NucB deoxyribonuclease domain-containing protein [Solirubrobacteraceae bacterium]|nr:NucA/NucB deoxyribonuclease domain-containing protein [Solirubrobacteraceae bacterium]
MIPVDPDSLVVDGDRMAARAVEDGRDLSGPLKDAEEELPTVVFSRAKGPNIGDNFDYAVQNGAPTTLNRVTDRSIKRANRADALNEHPPPPPGMSLDEYPFASTEQGGAGAFVRPVPEAEQHYQGGTLSSFYREHNIGTGDPFKVKFDP